MLVGSSTAGRAFDRIDDFEVVQSGRSGDELVAAVTRLQESVGILDESRSLIAERLAEIKGAPRAPRPRATRAGRRADGRRARLGGPLRGTRQKPRLAATSSRSANREKRCTTTTSRSSRS
jgi:hypothetical protein